MDSMRKHKAILNRLTNCKQNFQRWIGFLQVHHPLVQTDLAVLRFVI